MGIEKVGIVFHEYCAQNKILKLVLPISNILLMATSVLKVIQNFISMGSLMATVVYVVFILAVLLTFAKSDYRTLSLGMGIYLFDYVYGFFRTLVRYQRLNWSALTYFLLWAFFAYMAYKKSIKLAS